MINSKDTMKSGKNSANNKTEEMLIKANIRLDELERQKTTIDDEINRLKFDNEKLRRKELITTKNLLKNQIRIQREKIYKMYLETCGKNGISKIIMKTMMPTYKF